MRKKTIESAHEAPAVTTTCLRNERARSRGPSCRPMSSGSVELRSAAGARCTELRGSSGIVLRRTGAVREVHERHLPGRGFAVRRRLGVRGQACGCRGVPGGAGGDRLDGVTGAHALQGRCARIAEVTHDVGDQMGLGEGVHAQLVRRCPPGRAARPQNCRGCRRRCS